MKRRNYFLIILSLILLLLISQPGLSYVPSADIAPLGDLNRIVNSSDALVGLRFASGLNRSLKEDIQHGDVASLDDLNKPNPDAAITVGDALVILRKALGIVSF
jgi:hypothetical protein